MKSPLYIDLETYSAVDLPKAGVYRYTEDPSFQILMAAWSNGGPVQVAIGHKEILQIPGLLDKRVLKVAHNAQFERVALSRLARLPVGKYLNPESFHDTMAVAAERGYPLSLDPLARWLGGAQKDTAGTRLINLFCKPNRRGERTLPEDKPEEWDAFVEYCRQDVVTLMDVHAALGDWPTTDERDVFHADQRINDRGMAVDLALARAAYDAAEENRMVQELEISSLTGVLKPGSRDQMLAWLRGQGLVVDDLKAATVAQLLTGDLQPTVRRVLELRQELALVAAKKFGAALDAVSADGRLRGGFRFYGAHTGRWAGRGVQPHNMPREQFEDEVETETAVLDLMLGNGADALTLKRLVRSMFTGPYTVVDYSAIEARVLAWLAGEQWALDAFASGRDIYVETAGRMGGLTRFQGKVAVLALGYNGGVNSLRAMGGDKAAREAIEKFPGNQPSEPVEFRIDRTLQEMVTQWRESNPHIVAFWKRIQEAFQYGGRVGRHIRITADEDTRYVHLPSGRTLVYRKCRWRWVDKTWPSGDTSRVLQASFADPRKIGIRVETYGGRLTENVTQAVARDVLAEALVRLDAAGQRVAAHVHDEVIVEGSDLRAVERIVTTPPRWADGLPIDGEGFICKRYRKG